MKSFDAVRKMAESPSSVVWEKNIGTAIFAAVLLVCSVAVGCSSDKPKPANSASQIPMTPPHMDASSPAPSPEVAKADLKKVAKKRSTTRIYKDKAYGVSFVYPRKYGVETGDAASELIAASPEPLISTQNGGVSLAVVKLPETAFPKTDFSSAFFGVSVNKALTAEQCGLPAAKDLAAENKAEENVATATESAKAASTASATATSTSEVPASDTTKPEASAPVTATAEVQKSSTESSAVVAQSNPKLGDAEMITKESVAGEGARQDDAKYYRTFQNGACYEFALNVTTEARDEAGMKHVDRDKVFNRLEKILATVKIDAPKMAPLTPAETPAAEKTASTPAVASAQTPQE